MRIWVLALGLIAAPAMAADDGPINLVCSGIGEKDRSSSTYGIVGGTAGVFTSETRVNFEDSVSIRLNADNTGEGRIPRRIQPAYKQGGRNGWFPLANVHRAADEITGQIRFHSMYKPRFRLDRITGRISLSGNLGDFSGQCQAFDPASVERKF